MPVVIFFTKAPFSVISINSVLMSKINSANPIHITQGVFLGVCFSKPVFVILS